MVESKVESVDIKGKSMKLAKGGEDITFDKLIIATGSTVSLQLFWLASALVWCSPVFNSLSYPLYYAPASAVLQDIISVMPEQCICHTALTDVTLHLYLHYIQLCTESNLKTCCRT